MQILLWIVIVLSGIGVLFWKKLSTESKKGRIVVMVCIAIFFSSVWYEFHLYIPGKNLAISSTAATTFVFAIPVIIGKYLK